MNFVILGVKPPSNSPQRGEDWLKSPQWEDLGGLFAKIRILAA